MSVIVGFEVDQHVASPGKRPLDKQTSALSMALSSPRSCDSSASQRLKPAAFCCSDQRSDDAEDTYSCYSDEDDDDEELPSSSQSSMPIPRPSSRVAKLFAYARFQLHVQQAQLQELQQQQHDTALHQQHYQCQVQRAPHGMQQQHQQRMN